MQRLSCGDTEDEDDDDDDDDDDTASELNWTENFIYTRGSGAY